MHWNLPHMILITGNGRNVGKTTFAINIIRHLSESKDVIGIKVSPHIHDLNEGLEIICKTQNFIVAEEKGLNNKDSSLLLQAGAKRVYFIMAKQEDLEQAFSVIAEKLKDHIVVVESGGLSELITPGVFFFVLKPDEQITKKHYLKYNPIMVVNGDLGFDFNPERFIYSKGRISLSSSE